jgi:subtilisin family serine protease
MRSRIGLIGLIGLILIFNFQFSIFNSSAYAVYEEGAITGADFVPGQVIVKYKEGETREDIKEAAAVRKDRAVSAIGTIKNQLENIKLSLEGKEPPEKIAAEIAKVEEELGIIETKPIIGNFALVKTKENLSPGFFISNYSSLENVEDIGVDLIVRIQKVPNDEYYPRMWNLRAIKMEEAWDKTEGSSNIIVAVLDTGADYNHPDLKDHLISGYNFVRNSDNPQDNHGHGTHVSGTIGALTNNSIGIAGINWDVKIMPLKVLSAGGSGNYSAISSAIKYAANHGANVINMSLGGPGRCGGSVASQTYQEAINYARNKGVVIVVAAGNDHINAGWFTPASCSGVITVGAVGPDDSRAFYSNFGGVVDIAAPGGSVGSNACARDSSNCILSLHLGGGYTNMAGTSMASPHVAGAAALILAANPSLTPDRVEEILKSSADPITTDKPIGNRMNVEAALEEAAGEGGDVSPSVTGEPTEEPTSRPTNRPTETPINCSVDGDYDGNGSVEPADFEAWKTDYLAGEATLSCFEYWRRASFVFEP